MNSEGATSLSVGPEFHSNPLPMCSSRLEGPEEVNAPRPYELSEQGAERAEDVSEQNASRRHTLKISRSDSSRKRCSRAVARLLRTAFATSSFGNPCLRGETTSVGVRHPIGGIMTTVCSPQITCCATIGCFFPHRLHEPLVLLIHG